VVVLLAEDLFDGREDGEELYGLGNDDGVDGVLEGDAGDG
jgi:hypothetical protein